MSKKLFLLILPFLLLAFDISKIKDKAKVGNAEALRLMGFFYEEGIGVEKSVQKAIDFYKKAAQKGDLEAKIKLKILQKAKKISKKELKAKEIEDFQTVVNSLINRYDKKKRAVLKRKFSDKLGLYPYKENYFLPFAYDFDEKKDRNQKEAKFQFSVIKPFFYNLLGADEIYAFGYTQQSNWQIYSNSSPFRETNYESEIFVMVPTFYLKEFPLIGYKIILNHQSNGQPQGPSKSWNRIILEGIFEYKNIILSLQGWYRIPEPKESDDNPDILSYLGYGQFSLGIPIKDHFVKIKLRNNLRSDNNRGSVQIDWSFPFFLFKRTFGYIQYFNGYGESLIDYNNNVNKVGFGVMFTR